MGVGKTAGSGQNGSGHREKAALPTPIAVESLPTPTAVATLVRSGQTAALPTPHPAGSGHREKPALPTPGRENYRKRGGWIEFRKKNDRRYARRRSWQKVDGRWIKAFHGRVSEIPVMSEEEYSDYVNKRERAKRIRRAGLGR